MKKTIAILTAVVCAGSMSASASLLVGFETWDTNPNGGSGVTNAATSNATGFSGDSITQAATWSRSALGASTDGTFGTLAGADTGTTFKSGLALNNGANGAYDFTVSNNSGSSYALDFFRFDTGTFRPNAAHEWTVSIQSGDLTAQTVLSGSADNITGGVTDWYDYDIALSGITGGNVLADGESVTFRLDMAGGTGASGHHQYVDNIAISGNVIPEPATLGLVAAFGGAVLFIRRRFMI